MIFCRKLDRWRCYFGELGKWEEIGGCLVLFDKIIKYFRIKFFLGYFVVFRGIDDVIDNSYGELLEVN